MSELGILLRGSSVQCFQVLLKHSLIAANNEYCSTPPLTQARKLKLPDFQVRILCDEWTKLDRDATYLLPVHHLPLLWQTVSDKGQHVTLQFLPTRHGPVSGFTGKNGVSFVQCVQHGQQYSEETSAVRRFQAPDRIGDARFIHCV